jgi:hypothetical protein
MDSHSQPAYDRIESALYKLLFLILRTIGV